MATLLTETAERLFGQHNIQLGHSPENCGTQAARWPDTLWQDVVDAGMPLALLTEDQGGFDFDPSDVLAILPIAARFDTPIPLAESLLANWLFAQAGMPATNSPCALVSGLRLEKTKTSWRVHGRVERIPFGRHLRCLAGVAETNNGELYIACIENFSLGEESYNLAGEARDTLHIDSQLPVDAVRAINCSSDSIFSRCALLRAAAMAGAMELILERCVNYANERKQFGRHIGKFQAIQHYLASMAAEVAAVQMAVTAAAIHWDNENLLTLYAAAAKVRAGEAAGLVSANAHQIHGAIGFSWEYPLHPFTRKLWAWREEYGNETYWSEHIGKQLIARGAGSLWPALTQTGGSQ